MDKLIVGFEHLGMGDVSRVGGKNASLGEMIANLTDAGVRVPGGFASTAHAYREFIRINRLDERIRSELDALDVNDVRKLAETGARIRDSILQAAFPDDFDAALTQAFSALSHGVVDESAPAVAVRSSATAEDLPDASFAGQQETFLNVRGLAAVKRAVKMVFASLFNDRAIAYRVHQGFDHHSVALSCGIQRMVRSDIGSAGVMFTLDTESGFDDAVFITSSYGLGEMVVQGAVNPDEFFVHKANLDAGRPAILRRNIGSKLIKMTYADTTAEDGAASVQTVDTSAAERSRFSLDDEQVEQLARYARIIEQHYARPMDIEWGLDGADGGLYILQARPETVESRSDSSSIARYALHESGPLRVTGRAIGQRIGAGSAKVIASIADMDQVLEGDVLITDMTDPDWEPVMKRAAAIVTNRGGRTCHAAIIARELGIPAVVGCGDATEVLEHGEPLTVSCAEGDEGKVYAGLLDFSVSHSQKIELPALPTKIMMNVGNPGRAFQFSRIPNQGVGLARLEFIISTTIGVHPMALLEYARLPVALQEQINDIGCGYFSGHLEAYSGRSTRDNGYSGGTARPEDFYISKLIEGISTLAASFAGKPVIVRMSDFKSNEYANLIGGQRYEPQEENPMIGFRGASRYIAEEFRPCFELECRAIRFVREQMGFDNVEIMIPFVRTLEEAAAVIDLLAENGLKRGEHGLRVIMMCELPSNAVLADEFLAYFDGFSIGSNDMTQLTLGLDRDSGLVAGAFDERNPAVKEMLAMAIRACREQGKYVGICGQGPSDYPELAEWLLDQQISSISLNPDTVVDTWQRLAGQGRAAE